MCMPIMNKNKTIDGQEAATNIKVRKIECNMMNKLCRV